VRFRPFAIALVTLFAFALARPLHAARSRSPALTAEAVNAPTKTVVGGRSRGPAVLRAQVLLERARFSPGEIDGMSGSNMRRAVVGYQKAHDLKPSGAVDAATWAALDADAAPIVVPYTITADDVAGPFVPVPADMMEKSKLPRLGYASALEALAEKFHSSPRLLQQLNPGKDLAAAGTEILVPSVEPSAPVSVAKIVVDESDSTVSMLDAEGAVVAQYPATTGSVKDPLPVGEWKIQGIASDPVFHYNPELFWDANPEHAEATIPAGPNSPVGVAWIDLSKEHYGIHGTPEPSKIGKTESHGCIRMTNWAAAELARSVSAGMTAVLQP
jgi:lipoprotein-anchoring transpeptidase ErfK/SrfK